MAAANISDLFGDTDDDDDFTPAQRPQSPATGAAAEEETATPSARVSAAELLEDDDDDFQERPAPLQPSQLREPSDDDEDNVVQDDIQERPKGPPLEMSGALLPVPPIGRLRLLQASKFLAVQPLPTTPENLLLERGSTVDEATGAVRHSYRKQLTIRWRERALPSGEKTVESNARFVRWSDGSTQLHLGDEALDIAELDNTSASQFLFVRHTHPLIFIQGQGQLIKKLHLRPASLSSRFHRALTADAARKHVRVSRVKATATVRDPRRLEAEREKAEEERIRSRETLQRRQEREMKKYPAVTRRSELRPSGITTQFLETLEDEPDYSSDEAAGTAGVRGRESLQRRRQAEDDELEDERRLASAKLDATPARRPAENQTPRNERPTPRIVVSDEDDDDDDVITRHPVKKARRGLVISDEEDD